MNLNQRAFEACQSAIANQALLRISQSQINSATVLDFGIDQPGGLAAGIELARICMADLAQISISPGESDLPFPCLNVQTDHPLHACMASQYAGWPISLGKYFSMGSGPARSLRGKEELLDQLELSEKSDHCVAVLETAKLPNDDVVQLIAEECKVDSNQLVLACASTSSIAGTVQVVARSIETSLHKMHELGFDLHSVVSGAGSAPISPPGKDDMASIGLTNDAILYGGRVTIWIDGEDDRIAELGPKLPSSASSDYGKPFGEIFKSYDCDFYKIDPMLFSPAAITLMNLRTGFCQVFGETNHGLLNQTFLTGTKS